MLRTLIIVLSTFALALSAEGQQCPFSGITLNGFGTGTGTCADSVLNASLDTSACRVDFDFQPEPFICGNVFLSHNILLVGASPLPQPFALSNPFLPGSNLYVAPVQAFGPFPGGKASLPVPPEAILIGQSLTFQSVPFYFSTIPFPGHTEIGTSTGLTVTLN